MTTRVNINSNILTWAISRAGFDLELFTLKNLNVQKWIDGDKQPTLKQLETFAKKVYLPLGYLFLKEPPKEELSIPYFRSNNQKKKVSINVSDTISLLQRRQDWLKNYLLEDEYANLPFVGKYKNSFDVKDIVNDIRTTLKLKENWASEFDTWQHAQDHLSSQIEEIGIIMSFNGIVENNTYRTILVTECRGFVLVDDIVPFMFVNNSDSKAAQMFTILHELAHIWTGHSAGFDFSELQPANDPIEQLCDKVAAEFLVPQSLFNEYWTENTAIKAAAKYFKVSEIVIARRALDTNNISKDQFFAFYNEYISREQKKKEVKNSGGNFYATTKKRLSITFVSHINNAVKSGRLLYRDAYKLTSLKGDTFQTFINKNL